MLTISDRAALAHVLTLSIDPNLKALLRKREEQLAEAADLSEMARFIPVEENDTVESIESELGFSPFENFIDGSRFPSTGYTPSWEWLLDHGLYWEAVFVLSDSGYAEVLFVGKNDNQLSKLFGAFPDHASADY